MKNDLFGKGRTYTNSTNHYLQYLFRKIQKKFQQYKHSTFSIPSKSENFDQWQKGKSAEETGFERFILNLLPKSRCNLEKLNLWNWNLLLFSSE